jgi:hypothetical protein
VLAKKSKDKGLGESARGSEEARSDNEICFNGSCVSDNLPAK